MNRERILRVYIALIGSVAACIVAAAVFLVFEIRVDHSIEVLAAASFFVALGIFTSRQQVTIGESSTHLMGTIAHIATLILFPFPVAILVVGASKVVSEASLQIMGRRRFRHVVVNTGATILSNSAAGGAFDLMNGQEHLFQHGLTAIDAIPALIALIALYIGIEALVIVGAITLSAGGETPWTIFRDLVREMYRGEISLTFVGITFATLCHFSPVAALFIVVPITWSFNAFESAARMRKETVNSVLKMAESIDYRDTGTYEHSQRLAELTRKLGIELGLMPEHIEDIVLASRVHDLGKIGISNEILLKQGPLTPEERETMQEHPIIGAAILSEYSAFQNSVTIVKHHHERWDGKGYPEKLKGDQIPVGSRIIGVVDSFDSMIADRPYRAGMPIDIAVQRLKDGMGSQFDPKVCAAFIQILIEEGKYSPSDAIPSLHIVNQELSAS